MSKNVIPIDSKTKRTSDIKDLLTQIDDCLYQSTVFFMRLNELQNELVKLKKMEESK